MKWPFFAKRDEGLDELLERYLSFRRVGRELNVILAQSVPKLAVMECGKKLGLVNKGTLIFNNDDEIAILYDYCFHHFRRDHKSVIERYRSQATLSQIEAELLDAMQASFYSIFKLEKIYPKRGAKLLDLVSKESYDLFDQSVCNTGEAGIILIGRILPLPHFNISSGTLIPVHELVYQEKLKPIVEKFMQASYARLSTAQKAAFVAQIIRVALYAAGEDGVFYTDMEPFMV